MRCPRSGPLLDTQSFFPYNARMNTIPNRKELAAVEEEQAQLFLREFDARRYPGYYRRIYDPTTYLNEIGIDKICELVEFGNGLSNVAEAVDLSTTTLRRWISKEPSYRQKFSLAYIAAGEAYAFKGEQALKSAYGGSKEDIALAGKLAEHYRWMATKLDREKFGEVKDKDEKKNVATIININTGGKTDEPLLKTIEHDDSPPLVQMNPIDMSHLLKLSEGEG